jgi:hypothetical protein
MKQVAILNFETAEVEIKLLPKRLHDAQMEDVEEWLSDKGYSLDNIQFMYGDIKFSMETCNTELEEEDAQLLASKV